MPAYSTGFTDLVNTTQMQRQFFARHGEIHDFEDLTRALRDHLDAAAQTHRIHGQLTENRLIGLHWKMERTTVPYLGESIEHAQLRRDNRDYNRNKDLGYSGKIWFRLEHEVINSPSAMFHGSMVHIGTGGYSTFGGPWNEFGDLCRTYEVGVPHHLRKKLAAYCFQCHFYVSDFPEMDEYSLMLKLSDNEMPEKFEKHWNIPELLDRDAAYIRHLKKYSAQGHKT